MPCRFVFAYFQFQVGFYIHKLSSVNYFKNICNVPVSKVKSLTFCVSGI